MSDVNKTYQKLREAVKGESFKTIVVEASYLAGEKIAHFSPENRNAAFELAVKCMREAMNDELMDGECEGAG